MSESRPFSFTIPKPCHEDWEKMSIEEKGRFCQVCQKTVTDFTNAPDEEIIRIYSERKHELCGGFRPSQLRASHFSLHLSQNHFSQLRNFCLVLLFVFGTSLFSFGSVSAKNAIYRMKEKFRNYADTLQMSDSVYTMKGKISDKETKEGIPFVNIELRENDTLIARTVTDDEGNFLIRTYNPKIKNRSHLILKAGTVGYKALIVTDFPEGDLEPFLMEPIPMMILGGMVETINYDPSRIDPFYPGHRTITRKEWQHMPK